MKKTNQWVSSKELFPAVEELLSTGKQAAFTVTGMSMWPFLCHGRDQVIVEKADPDNLHKGDIILFCDPRGIYILHRITGLNAKSFQTTGDGVCFRDGWFPREAAKAKVIRLIRDKKELNCKSPMWKCIFHIWMALFPIRNFLLKLLRTGWKIAHKAHTKKTGDPL